MAGQASYQAIPIPAGDRASRALPAGLGPAARAQDRLLPALITPAPLPTQAGMFVPDTPPVLVPSR